MADYPADWLFRLALQIAVAVCLSTLAFGLLSGVNPLTALLRAGTAFGTFLLLGWTASRLWETPPSEPVTNEPGGRPQES